MIINKQFSYKMFVFSKVEEAIIEPYKNKFTFGYNILVTLNVFPKEINIFILSLRCNHLFEKLYQVNQDEKLSLMLQVLGVTIINNHYIAWQELKVVKFMMQWSTSFTNVHYKSDIYHLNPFINYLLVMK